MDLISRAAAIYVASGCCHPANITKELAKLPSAQRWIPCSERLPEGTGFVIVTKIDGEGGKSVCQMWYSERNGWEWNKSPLAWMPLPEPFKEGEV